MNDDKDKVTVNPEILKKITKKIVRLEKENSIQKEKSDLDMENILKRVIEGELK